MENKIELEEKFVEKFEKLEKIADEFIEKTEKIEKEYKELMEKEAKYKKKKVEFWEAVEEKYGLEDKIVRYDKETQTLKVIREMDEDEIKANKMAKLLVKSGDKVLKDFEQMIGEIDG